MMADGDKRQHLLHKLELELTDFKTCDYDAYIRQWLLCAEMCPPRPTANIMGIFLKQSLFECLVDYVSINVP